MKKIAMLSLLLLPASVLGMDNGLARPDLDNPVFPNLTSRLTYLNREYVPKFLNGEVTLHDFSDFCNRLTSDATKLGYQHIAHEAARVHAQALRPAVTMAPRRLTFEDNQQRS